MCVYISCRRAHAETVAASVGYSHERNERRRDVIVELREQPTHQWPPYPRQLLHALEQTKKSAELVSFRELRNSAHHDARHHAPYKSTSVSGVCHVATAAANAVAAGVAVTVCSEMC